MPIIDTVIGNRTYELYCDDGEQNNIRQLSKKVSSRIKSLEKVLGQTSENKILAITCLMLEDELRNMSEKSNNDSDDIEPNQDVKQDLPSIEEIQIKALEPLVQKLENIAKKVEILEDL